MSRVIASAVLLAVFSMCAALVAGCGAAATTTTIPTTTTTQAVVMTTTTNGDLAQLGQFLATADDAMKLVKAEVPVDAAGLQVMITMLDRYDLPAYDPPFTEAKVRLQLGLQAWLDYEKVRQDPTLASWQVYNAGSAAAIAASNAAEEAQPYLDQLRAAAGQ